MRKRIIPGKHTAAVTLQNETFIRMNNILKIEFADIQTFTGRINPVDQCRIDAFKNFVGLLKNIDVNYLIGNIIFANHPNRAGLHTQIDIFGHQNCLHIGMFPRQIIGNGKNLMIWLARRKRITHYRRIDLTRYNEQTP